MNILITFLTAKLNTFGGVEKSIFSLINGLEKTGNNVFVYTSKNDDNLKNFYYSNYSKYSITTRNHYNNWWDIYCFITIYIS